MRRSSRRSIASDFPADYRFNLASPKITPGGSGTSPNLLIHTAREDFPFRNTALAGHLARLVSIALGTLTVVGIFAVARRLLRDDRLALLATAFVAFIPQFVYGAALVNNDALAACAGDVVVLRVAALDGRWPLALGAVERRVVGHHAAGQDWHDCRAADSGVGVVA